MRSNLTLLPSQKYPYKADPPSCTDCNTKYLQTALEFENDDKSQETVELGETLEEHEDCAQCAICLEKFQEGDQLCSSRNMDCKHVFHSECIYRWLLKHEECPYCRQIFLLYGEESCLDLEAGLSGQVKNTNLEESRCARVEL